MHGNLSWHGAKIRHAGKGNFIYTVTCRLFILPCLFPHPKHGRCSQNCLQRVIFESLYPSADLLRAWHRHSHPQRKSPAAPPLLWTVVGTGRRALVTRKLKKSYTSPLPLLHPPLPTPDVVTLPGEQISNRYMETGDINYFWKLPINFLSLIIWCYS